VSKSSILAVAGAALAAASLFGSSAVAATGASARSAGASPFLASLHTVSTVGSTVPANGDINPYGLAVVPTSVGSLESGTT